MVSEGRPCEEQNALVLFQNESFPPPSAGGIRGFFSIIHHKTLVELQEIKLTKVWGTACDSGSPESQTYPHRASSNSSFAVQVSSPWYSFPWRFLLLGFSSSRLWVSVFATQSLEFGRPQFALWPHFSLVDLRRVADFSVCLAFLLVIRIEKQVPSFLPAGPENWCFL